MTEPHRGRAGEYRIGPLVFAPGWGAPAGADRWSHRRGEPRLFGLLWVLFVIASVSTTLLAVRGAGGPTVDRYEFAALAMLEALLTGVCVLWPMVRLSQARPKNAVRAALADAAIVMVPVTAVLLPLPLFTQWPISVVAAAGGVIAASVVGVVGVLSWATRSTSAGDRLAAMIILLLALVAAPAIGLMLPADPRLPWTADAAAQVWVWCSPLTALWALTRSSGNLVPIVDVGGWIVACWPLLPGVALLGVASIIPPRDGA